MERKAKKVCFLLVAGIDSNNETMRQRMDLSYRQSSPSEMFFEFINSARFRQAERKFFLNGELR